MCLAKQAFGYDYEYHTLQQDYNYHSAVQTNAGMGTRLKGRAKQDPAMKNNIPMDTLELFQTKLIEAKLTNTKELTTKVNLMDKIVA